LDRLALRSSLVLPALVVLATGFTVLALAPNLWMTFLGAIIVGASFNGISVPMLALLGDVTRPEQYGRGVGLYQFFGDVGGSLGPILGLEAGLRFGMLPTYLGVGGLLMLSIPIAFWAHRREHRWRMRNRMDTN
jgi:MFS family permease